MKQKDAINMEMTVTLTNQQWPTWMAKKCWCYHDVLILDFRTTHVSKEKDGVW